MGVFTSNDKTEEVVNEEAPVTEEVVTEELPDSPVLNCPDCKGEGLKSDTELCPTCNGIGRVE